MASERELLAQLARYSEGSAALHTVDAVDLFAVNNGHLIPGDDAGAALQLLPAARRELEYRELRIIEAARNAGETWQSLAVKAGYRSEQALQQRYRRIGGRRSWSTSGKPVGDGAEVTPR